MLTPEQSAEQLKKFQDAEFRKKQTERVAACGEKIALVGETLLTEGSIYSFDVDENNPRMRRRAQAVQTLAKLDAKQRSILFAALFPKLGTVVEAAWDLFSRLPFQFHYLRRPFRSPTDYLPNARIFWLGQLIAFLKLYDQDVEWLAAWAPYLGYAVPDTVGLLCAAAIDCGGAQGQAVFDTLVASGSGTHEIGMMGRHVVRGLLCASRPEGWAFIERLLLAAQREEGLRQAVLERIDESHPAAFRRLLRVIVENNLIRFSATVRACDVWFGLRMETAPASALRQTLESVLRCMEDPKEIEKALEGENPQEIYLALWSIAFDDVRAALPKAVALRKSADAGKRLAAVHFLAQVELPEAVPELSAALDDEDLRIPARVLETIGMMRSKKGELQQGDTFEGLERLVARLKSKETTLKPLVWDWMARSINREQAADCLPNFLGDRPLPRLFPHLSQMSPQGRAHVARLIKESERIGPEEQKILLELVGDASVQVRQYAFDAIEEAALAEPEIEQLEGYLRRQADDLRRGVIQLLMKLPDPKPVQSAGRLLAERGGPQRAAGLEILRECIRAGRAAEECRGIAARFAELSAPSADENRILETILSKQQDKYSLTDALGLMNPANRSHPSPPPSNKKIKLGTPAAMQCLLSLDECVARHRTDQVELVVRENKVSQLLGNVNAAFPNPDPTLDLEQDLARLPLREVWEEWWRTRPPETRDADGLELLRALAVTHLIHTGWTGGRGVADIPKIFQDWFEIRPPSMPQYTAVTASILDWMIRAHPVAGEKDFLLDALEASIARTPQEELTGTRLIREGMPYRIFSHQRLAYLEVCRRHRLLRPGAWGPKDYARVWAVVRWIDEPFAGITRLPGQIEDALLALEAGGATRDDILDFLTHFQGMIAFGGRFSQLNKFTGRKGHPLLGQYPLLKELVESLRERVLEIETRRGDLPTAASSLAANLRSIPGRARMFRLLAAMGNTAWQRGYLSGGSRSAVLGHLIRASFLLEEDTPEAFARDARELKIPAPRLLELALYAPQWAAHVEHALGWTRLGEAVWWVYAHTKDRQWTIDPEVRELWAAQISEYTPLTADSLLDGAVDIQWFKNFYPQLGAEHWKEIYKLADLSSGGNGHVRARLFADAILGQATSEELAGRIVKKRHQDSVRALGLIPLPAGTKQKAEVARRYEVIQEFLRTGKKFGSMRQASEKLAAAIGMENLARTAGFADPQRLAWAMETEALKDLSSGALKVKAGEVQLALSINSLGEPELRIAKGEKELKAVPPAVKKDPKVVELLERKTQLDRQVSRMRGSLEQAMVRGDDFTAGELRAFLRHPMLRVMAEQLVFVSPKGLGYPAKGGEALTNASGKPIKLSADDRVRIAHPVDLLESGDWPEWQRECFQAERIQPFKQLFRELYVLTSAEKEEGNLTRRYAGNQVNPRQAVALFGSRGWVADPEEGVHKTFHALGITVHVGFLNGVFTPAEVEGLTIEAVAFTKRGEWTALALAKIPPRIFSEVMRDVDLVVSVAHAGGVDPEASASSIEAREALLRETCALLKLENVQLKNRHALVAGKLGNYTVHLGSAVVHRQPGGSICIIPVHGQQRGRLFLPFVDSDPKSAEVVSKVLLLAKDSEIKDPTILEQIMR